MDDITIRHIRPDDNAAVASIVRNVLTEFKANKPGTAYYDKNLDTLSDSFQQPGAAYWVVEMDGQVVGCGGIYPTANLPQGYCELVKLYFDEAMRGKGLGKKLINLCSETALQLGYTHLYLETMPELTIAVPLYERLGFEYLPGPLGNSGHTDCTIWMTKKLA